MDKEYILDDAVDEYLAARIKKLEKEIENVNDEQSSRKTKLLGLKGSLIRDSKERNEILKEIDRIKWQYLELLKKGNYYLFKDRIAETGLGLGIIKDEIQAAYVGYLQKFDLNNIRNLNNYTGLKPKIPDECIHEAYKKALTNEYYLDDFIEIVNLAQNDPDPELVQEAYSLMLMKGCLKKLIILYETTQIIPAIPDCTLQEGYEKALLKYRKEDSDSLKEITEIEKLTKKQITEETLQRVYNQLFEQEEYGEIVYLVEFTKTAPFLSKEKIIAGFQNTLEETVFLMSTGSRDDENPKKLEAMSKLLKLMG